jgi:hypothetical protein
VGYSASESERIGAMICVKIVAQPGKLAARALQAPDGRTTYVTAKDKLAFYAVMSPNCSYWNPSPHSLSLADLLQHEQVHFAIQELAARRLNASAVEIMARVQTSGTRANAVVERSTRALNEIVDQATREANRRHARFDEDASELGVWKVDDWSREVEAELASARALARGPQLLFEQRTRMQGAVRAARPATSSSRLSPPVMPAPESAPAVPTRSFPIP